MSQARPLPNSEEAAQNRPSGARSLLLLLCVVLGLGATRLIHLAADPPVDLSPSGGYFADEGIWLHNARNQLRWGEPIQDGWNPMLLSPLTHYAGWLAMRVFGLGLPQARISAAILFTLFLLLLGLWGRPRPIGILLALLAGTHFIAVMYGRLVLVDNLILLLAVTTALLLCRSLRCGGTAALWLAGACAGLCLWTKIVSIFLLPAWLGTILLQRWSGPDSWGRTARRLAWFSIAAGLIYLGLDVIFRWPRSEEISQIMAYYGSQHDLSVWGILKSVLTQRFFFYFAWTPIFLSLFLLALLETVTTIWRLRTIPESEVLISVLWFFCGVAFLALLEYRPLRYYLPLIPPMAYLVAHWLWGNLSGRSSNEFAPCGLVRLVFGAAGVTALLVLIDGGVYSYELLGRIEAGVGVSLWRQLVLLVICSFAVLAPKRLRALRRRKVARWALGAYLLLNLASFGAWALRPEYKVRETGRDLIARLPEEAVLSGQFALQLVFDSKLRIVPVWGGFYNSDHPFERYGIDTLLLWAYNHGHEIENMKAHFPDAMARAREVHRYELKRSSVLLYRLEPGPRASDPRAAGRGSGAKDDGAP